MSTNFDKNRDTHILDELTEEEKAVLHKILNDVSEKRKV